MISCEPAASGGTTLNESDLTFTIRDGNTELKLIFENYGFKKENVVTPPETQNELSLYFCFSEKLMKLTVHVKPGSAKNRSNGIENFW